MTTTTTFKIEGIHCAACKTLIEDVCQDLAGVSSCRVNVLNQIATIEHDSSVSPETIRKEIEGLGSYKTSFV